MQKRRRLWAMFAGALMVAPMAVMVPAAQAVAGASLAVPYYLALGDSLAVGLQPSSSGDVPTDKGYVNDIYSVYRRLVPGLQLEDLGCSGETTTSMIEGGSCSYSLGNQLEQAVAFLQTHDVVLVTIDIGANDVDHCITAESLDETCLQNGVSMVGSNLPKILGALHAASPDVPLVGMNYYDPFLAAWLEGSSGEAIAEQSLEVATDFNDVLASAYQAFDDPVADVAGAFQTTDSTPVLGVPVDVAAVCALTWMCAPAPLGPDFHANAAGYAVIAAAFAPKILAARAVHI